MKTIESLGCGLYAGAAYLRVNTVFVSYSVGQVKVDFSWYLTSCKV